MFIKCVLLTVCGAATGLSAQIINGGFEEPDLGFRSVAAGDTYGGWTNAGPGNIEFVRAEFRPGLFNLPLSAYEGSYWIDLVGVGNPSAIYQDVAGLTPGAAYVVEWAQAGNVWGSNFAFTMEVLWNGVVVASNTQIHGGSNGEFMNWQEREVQVIADPAGGPNRLSFRATNGLNARGAALDDVSIRLVPAPAASILLAGFGALASRRRR